jgi:hypothetical protein
MAQTRSVPDLVARAFHAAGELHEGCYVASLSDLYGAIVPKADEQPPDLDFGQVLLGQLIENPCVAELPDGRFAYNPQLKKGTSGQDPTTLAIWRESEAGRSMRSAVYTAETWIQPFYIRKHQYKLQATWEGRRALFRDAARRDNAYRYMHMELPEGHSYARASVHHRRKGAD